MILLICTPSFSEIRSIFDIGTGKIKMQIARVNKEQIEPLYCYAEQISLGHESILNNEGIITKDGENKIVSVLQSLKLLGESYGSTRFQAIATELFRKATNGKEIIKNISNLLDIEITIISPEEEGILSFLTIVQEANLDPEKIVVLDIGSGSFQITCKKGEQFLVYSVPFGRFATHQLVKNNDLSKLEIALSNIDPYITKKIQFCKNIIIGIGAHPKHILKLKTIYNKNDLAIALQIHPSGDLNYSDLLLVKTIMESLSIIEIKYLSSLAGNTSGLFLLERYYKFKDEYIFRKDCSLPIR